MIKKITVKQLLIFLLLASFFALLFAYISQYFFGLKPCILCLYQRKPFFAIILITLTTLLFLKSIQAQKIALALCVIALIINVGIAFYHVGVEQKIFKGLSTCSAEELNQINDVVELEKILLSLNTTRCDEIQFTFLHLSMAAWNLIYCLFLLISLIALSSNRLIRSKIISD